MNNMIRLETERLILRNYREEDIPVVYEYFSNIEVARYEDFAPMSMDEVRKITEEWIPLDNRLVAVRKEDMQLIGSVGYWVEEDGTHSIDYDFNPEFSERGYATEAAREVVRYLFEEKNIKVLYGDCDTRNERSYKLLERLGFQRIKQLENQSYKNDADGNPIIISTYLYKLAK